MKSCHLMMVAFIVLLIIPLSLATSLRSRLLTDEARTTTALPAFTVDSLHGQSGTLRPSLHHVSSDHDDALYSVASTDYEVESLWVKSVLETRNLDKLFILFDSQCINNQTNIESEIHQSLQMQVIQNIISQLISLYPCLDHITNYDTSNIYFNKIRNEWHCYLNVINNNPFVFNNDRDISNMNTSLLFDYIWRWNTTNTLNDTNNNSNANFDSNLNLNLNSSCIDDVEIFYDDYCIKYIDYELKLKHNSITAHHLYCDVDDNIDANKQWHLDAIDGKIDSQYSHLDISYVFLSRLNFHFLLLL